jgi:hypothetical protein
MTRTFKIIALFSLLLIGVTTVSAQGCERMSKREMSGILSGFHYDASRVTQIPHDERPLTVQFEVNLFSASVYNMVWCVEDMPPRAVIKVYEEERGSVKRKVVFDSSEATLIEDKRYSYEVRDGKHKRLTIAYEIPGHSSVGCILFIMGFRGSDSIARERSRYVIK